MEMAAGLLFSQTRAVRNAFRFALVLSVASLFAAASPRAVQSTHLKIIVGVTDDTAKWMVRQDGIVGVHRDLRLMAVRVTMPWRPGQVRPTKLQGVYLHRIARMAQLNDRIVLAVYNTAEYAPTTRKSRSEYCAFVQGAVRRIPLIHDVEIWNEANSPTYWPVQSGAEAYVKLLARSYDANLLPSLNIPARARARTPQLASNHHRAFRFKRRFN